MLGLLNPEFSCQLTSSLFFPFIFLLHLLQPEDKDRDECQEGGEGEKEEERKSEWIGLIKYYKWNKN